MDSDGTPLPDGRLPRTNPAPPLRQFSWLMLATGLALGTFLVAFWLGDIPGLVNTQGAFGTVVILAGAASTYASGITGWIFFSRLARRFEAGQPGRTQIP